LSVKISRAINKAKDRDKILIYGSALISQLTFYLNYSLIVTPIKVGRRKG
jgi:hypothetical protein